MGWRSGTTRWGFQSQESFGRWKIGDMPLNFVQAENILASMMPLEPASPNLPEAQRFIREHRQRLTMLHLQQMGKATTASERSDVRNHCNQLWQTAITTAEGMYGQRTTRDAMIDEDCYRFRF